MPNALACRNYTNFEAEGRSGQIDRRWDLGSLQSGRQDLLNDQVFMPGEGGFQSRVGRCPADCDSIRDVEVEITARVTDLSGKPANQEIFRFVTKDST